jgi:MerR family transcriptional regulator, light-induced transcriptional regulator
VDSPADDSLDDDLDLDLDEVAAEAGVHYQTVYRWVRAGKLPSVVIAGRYQIKRVDLVGFIEARNTPTRPKPPGPDRLERAAEKMHAALCAGDELVARDLARAIITEHTSVGDLIEKVLVPPLRRIGQDWHDGNLSIWVEHRASAITERILGEIAPRRRGRRRGNVMVAAVSGDRHSLATTMAAVTLRDNNWTVHHLGADMPPDELVRFCKEHDIDVAVLTLVNLDSAELAQATGARIAAAGTPAIVGGPGRTLEDLLQQVQNAARDLPS